MTELDTAEAQLGVGRAVLARRRALIALLILTALLTTKLVLLRMVTLGPGGPLGIVGDAAFIFALLCVVDLLFSDMRFRAYLVTDFLLSAAMVMVALFVSYYQLLPTKESLTALNQAATVGTSLASLIDPRYLFFFADIFVLLWWGIRCRRRRLDAVMLLPSGAPVVHGGRLPYVYQRKIVYVVGAAVAIALLVNVNSTRAITSEGDAKAIARERGLSTFLVASTMGSTGKTRRERYVPPAQKLQVRLNRLSVESSPTPVPGYVPGKYKGKNVIAIQVEAMQGGIIGLKVDGQEVTPNLNRYVAKSAYYPNHISGIGLGTTSDAEFITNTSLYARTVAAATLSYADREIPSLPRLLRNQGYEAYTFHTNDVSYWNRSQLYPALGFSQYFDKKYFGTQDKIAYGASDKVLFKKTLEKLKSTEESGSPFYAQIITLSSHFPFIEIPQKDQTLKVSAPYTGTIEGDYLKAMHYADGAIGTFLDDLEKSGLADDTIVIIYGDHFGLPEPRKEAESQALQAIYGHAYSPVDRLTTPLIVHLPGQTKGAVYQEPVGQIDMMPTVADALGVDISSTPHVGRSVFYTGPRVISPGGLLPAGSYVDGELLYVPGDRFETGKRYSMKTHMRDDTLIADETKFKNTQELLRLSDAYARGLAKRADYDPNAKLVLPNQ